MQSKELEEVFNSVMEYPNIDSYSMEEVDAYINVIKYKSVKDRIDVLKKEMKNTIDIEEKKKLADRILKMERELLKW